VLSVGAYGAIDGRPGVGENSTSGDIVFPDFIQSVPDPRTRGRWAISSERSALETFAYLAEQFFGTPSYSTHSANCANVRFTPKADMIGHILDVRFVSKDDIEHRF
jgi:hypothetical protein